MTSSTDTDADQYVLAVSRRRVKRLRALMRERGITQTGLAASRSITASYISQLFSGHRQFGEKSARTIEASMGVPLGYLDYDAAQCNGPEMLTTGELVELIKALLDEIERRTTNHNHPH